MALKVGIIRECQDPVMCPTFTVRAVGAFINCTRTAPKTSVCKDEDSGMWLIGLSRSAHVCYRCSINLNYSDCGGYLTCIINQSINSYIGFFPTKGDIFMSTAQVLLSLAGCGNSGNIFKLSSNRRNNYYY